uniref:Uncharacterized protein n=1 Tax=Salarias fasciatus TaxID=181472 RepID=A0A672FA61_SALFA
MFSKQSLNITQPGVFLRGEELEIVPDFKYSGVILDSTLSFKKHVKNLSNTPQKCPRSAAAATAPSGGSTARRQDLNNTETRPPDAATVLHPAGPQPRRSAVAPELERVPPVPEKQQSSRASTSAAPEADYGGSEEAFREPLPPQGDPGTPPQGDPGTPPQGDPGTPPQGDPGTLPQGDPGTPGNAATGRPGNAATGRPGNAAPGRPGNAAPGRPGNAAPGRPGNHLHQRRGVNLKNLIKIKTKPAVEQKPTIVKCGLLNIRSVSSKSC